MKYLLTGRTGSGMSSAKRVFERNGFRISYPRLSNFKSGDYGGEHKHLVVIDVNTAIVDEQEESRLVQYYQNFYASLGKDFKVVYLDADESVLFRRQQQDQLPPLYSKLFNVPWMKAFAMEKKVLSPFSENADLFFDTTSSPPQDLGQAIDMFINLEIEHKVKTSSYHELLSRLYHENFWANIGNRMSLFCEIAEAPKIAEEFLRDFNTRIRAPLTGEKIRAKIAGAGRILLTGMGSSYFAGDAVKELLQKCYNVTLPLDAIPLSELGFCNLKDALVIINSNSGETGEIKECFGRNLFNNAVAIFGITNNLDSFLGKKCQAEGNLVFSLGAMREQSIPATVSVTANLLVLSGILAILQDNVNPSGNVAEILLKDLNRLPSQLRELMSQGMMNQIYSWANKMAAHFKAGTGFVVGCGALTAIVPEAALKGIELARLHLSPLKHSFAHGPLNAGTLEGALYLQDILTSKNVIVSHIEKLIQHCPVFSVGPYWDINLPNLYTLACNADNAATNLFTQLVAMQLAYTAYGLMKGLSVNEICRPSMLQKVVLSSPIS